MPPSPLPDRWAALTRAVAAAGLCAAGLVSPPASAQIVTDRPDFVESSVTVGRGGLQVEASLAFDSDGAHPSRVASWCAPTLVRFGLGPAWEVRMGSDVFVRDASSPGHGRGGGVADLDIGVKWHALDPSGLVPSAALLIHSGVPTGARSVRAGGVTPSLRLVAEWELPGAWGLGVMPGVASTPSVGGRYLAGILGIVAGREVAPGLRAFGELAVEHLPVRGRGGAEGSLNGGVAWAVTDAVQLDAALSLGATAAAPDFAMTVGVSRRIAP